MYTCLNQDMSARGFGIVNGRVGKDQHTRSPSFGTYRVHHLQVGQYVSTDRMGQLVAQNATQTTNVWEMPMTVFSF
jgi:hypothetical protein